MIFKFEMYIERKSMFHLFPGIVLLYKIHEILKQNFSSFQSMY